MIIWVLFVVTSLGQVTVIDNIANAEACNRLGLLTVTSMVHTPAGQSSYWCQSTVKLTP